jgi:hypothetical protein
MIVEELPQSMMPESGESAGEINTLQNAQTSSPGVEERGHASESGKSVLDETAGLVASGFDLADDVTDVYSNAADSQVEAIVTLAETYDELPGSKIEGVVPETCMTRKAVKGYQGILQKWRNWTEQSVIFKSIGKLVKAVDLMLKILMPIYYIQQGEVEEGLVTAAEGAGDILGGALGLAFGRALTVGAALAWKILVPLALVVVLSWVMAKICAFIVRGLLHMLEHAKKEARRRARNMFDLPEFIYDATMGPVQLKPSPFD